MGRLAGIARREEKRAPMETLEQAEVSDQTGVARDFRGKPGKRTVLQNGSVSIGDPVTVKKAD